MLICLLGSASWVRPNYLGFENSRSQIYYLCHDIFIFSQLWLASYPRSKEMWIGDICNMSMLIITAPANLLASSFFWN